MEFHENIIGPRSYGFYKSGLLLCLPWASSAMFRSSHVQTRMGFDQRHFSCKGGPFRSSDQEEPSPRSNPTRSSTWFIQLLKTGQTDIRLGKPSTNSIWFNSNLPMATRRYSRPTRRHPRRPTMHQQTLDQEDPHLLTLTLFGCMQIWSLNSKTTQPSKLQRFGVLASLSRSLNMHQHPADQADP